MSFAAPLALLGLLVIPLAIAVYLIAQRRRGKYAVRFTNLDLLANVVQRSPGWRRHVPPAVYALAVGALLLALARPEMTVKVPKEEATVVLVMDTSGSMNATDIEPTRLVAARWAAETLVDELPEGFRLTLITFSTGVQTRVPATTDRQAILDALNSLQSLGGTAMGDALQHAVESVAPVEVIGANGGSTATPTPAAGTVEPVPEDSPSVIILLSDGYNTVGSLDPITAAANAAELGIPVFTIALGTEDGVAEVTDQQGFRRLVPVPPDEETLEEVAEMTGASFFSAPTADDLKGIYEDLGSQIGYDEETRDITAWFTGAGAALVLVAGGLSLAWFSRFP
ncbi:MAG: VWA domain-containing protein [Tepidiformaceae bacterium]